MLLGVLLLLLHRCSSSSLCRSAVVVVAVFDAAVVWWSTPFASARPFARHAIVVRLGVVARECACNVRLVLARSTYANFSGTQPIPGTLFSLYDVFLVVPIAIIGFMDDDVDEVRSSVAVVAGG